MHEENKNNNFIQQFVSSTPPCSTIFESTHRLLFDLNVNSVSDYIYSALFMSVILSKMVNYIIFHFGWTIPLRQNVVLRFSLSQASSRPWPLRSSANSWRAPQWLILEEQRVVSWYLQLRLSSTSHPTGQQIQPDLWKRHAQTHTSQHSHTSSDLLRKHTGCRRSANRSDEPPLASQTPLDSSFSIPRDWSRREH